MRWVYADLRMNNFFCLITVASRGLKNMYTNIMLDQKKKIFLKCLLGVIDFLVSIFPYFSFFKGHIPGPVYSSALTV